MKEINIAINVLIIFINILFVSAENNYLRTQFLKEKILLEKEAYREFKNSNIYKKQDSCKIKFIYMFDLPSLSESETSNNKYLSNIKPVYCFRRYWFSRKIQIEKRLCAEGYVFNKRNKLIAKIFSNRGYPFKIDTFVNSDYYNSRVKVFEDKAIELFFCVGYFNSRDVIWCLKENQTLIYNIGKAKYIPLEGYMGNDGVKIMCNVYEFL